MKIIKSKNAPAAIGPYSQAILVNNTLYISGQIPFDPKTMKLISNDIKKQAQQSLKNIEGILKEAKMKITNIVKCNIFMTDLKYFADVNQVYEKFFKNHKPARSCVEVSKLPKDVKIEIEAIAVK